MVLSTFRLSNSQGQSVRKVSIENRKPHQFSRLLLALFICFAGARRKKSQQLRKKFFPRPIPFGIIYLMAFVGGHKNK